MTARTVWCRPIRHGPHSGCGRCPHAHRLLARLRYRNGALYSFDWCINCAGRTDPISRADLWAIGIDAERLPRAYRVDERYLIVGGQLVRRKAA